MSIETHKMRAKIITFLSSRVKRDEGMIKKKKTSRPGMAPLTIS